jgi:hypothetical protein
MPLTLLGLLLAVDAPPPEPPVMDDRARVALAQTDNVRLSLPTEQDVEAWQRPGLRVALGYGQSVVGGWGPAPSFRGFAVMFRPSVRIDRWWGLGVAMLYGSATGGLRWSVTAEPTFYPWRQLALSVGLGYGGLSVSGSGPPGQPRGSEMVSRTLSDDERLRDCDGSAVSSLLRAEYLFVVGPLFATGPYLQGGAQWTRCHQTLTSDDPETGRPIVLTQWWRQASVTLGWWLTWR